MRELEMGSRSWDEISTGQSSALVALQLRRFTIAAGLLLGAIALLSAQAHAQSLSGHIVAAESTEPVAGALVIAWSANGDTVRALASSAGRYRVQLPRGGAYSVRVLRIGFSPSPVTAVSVPDRGDVSLDLRASVSPVRLDAVAVRGSTSCGPMRPEAVAIARVWEEARKAMLAVQLDADGEPLLATWMEYTRETDTTGRIVRSQQLRVQREPTRHVFTSVAPDSLLQYGFVTVGTSEVRYFAPDPTVLLSSAFTASHCFSLEPRSRAADSDSTVGLRFAPADSRNALRDIAGVVWVHAATGELRRIDFSYTNTPEASGITAGGSVEFARLPSGRWVVSRWRAQLPLVQRRLGSAVPGMSSMRGQDRFVASGMHSSGGEVIRVEQRGAVALERDVPPLRVVLKSRDTLVSVAGAEVAVEGSNVRGMSDAKGFVDLGPAPIGRYRVQLAFPGIDSAMPPQLTYSVELRATRLVDTLALPSRAKLLESLCTLPNSARSDVGTGLLRGTVLTQEGAPASATRVTIRFASTDTRALRAGVVGGAEQQLALTTDAQGAWRACGIPRGSDIAVEATTPSARATWRGRIDPIRLSQVVELRLAPAVRAVDSVTSTSAQPLAAVAVVATAAVERDSTHREPSTRSGGQHLTAQEIAQMRVEHSWQLLARVTGVQLRRVGGAVYAVASRGNAPSLQVGATACPLQLTVNGTIVSARGSDGVDLSELPRPEFIARLDVYPSGAEIPVSMGSQQRGSWCGLIAVTLK